MATDQLTVEVVIADLPEFQAFLGKFGEALDALKAVRDRAEDYADCQGTARDALSTLETYFEILRQRSANLNHG